jgi:hypothetical protein
VDRVRETETEKQIQKGEREEKYSWDRTLQFGSLPKTRRGEIYIFLKTYTHVQLV